MNLNEYALVWIELGVLFGSVWLACKLIRSPLVRQFLCRGAIVGAVILCALVTQFGVRAKPIAAVSLTGGPEGYTESYNTYRANEYKPDSREKSWEAKLNLKPEQPVRVLEPVQELREPMKIPHVLGLFGLLIWQLIGLVRLVILRDQSAPCADDRLLSLSRGTSAKLRLRRIRIRCLEGHASMFVVGAIWPTVYVGKGWLSEQSDNDLEAFLIHEAAHIARRDLMWLAFHRAMSILLWSQPFIWLLRKPMRQSSEDLCDRHVVATGINPAAYADGLLRVAEGRTGAALGVGLFSTRTALSARVETLLRGANLKVLRMGRLSKAAWLMSLAAVVGLTSFVFAIPLAPYKVESLMAKGSDVPDGIHSIRILTPDGKPLQKGRVLLIRRKFLKFDLTPLHLQNGTVNVELVNADKTVWSVVVMSPGYGMTFRQIFPSAEPFADIRMLDACNLRGRLIDRSGKPLSGVPIGIDSIVRDKVKSNLQVLLSMYIRPIRDLLSTTTDSNGQFEFQGLPREAKAQLQVYDDRFAQFGPDQQVDLGSKMIKVFDDIVVEAASTVAGRVTCTGKPVAGILVGAQSNNGWSEDRTKADGSYVLKRLSESSWIVALDLDEAVNTRWTAKAHSNITLKPGQNLTNVNFELEPGSVIKGRVVYSDGKPVLNTHVCVYGPAHPMDGAWVQGAYTDIKGNYLLRVPAGAQHLYLQDFGGPFKRDFSTKDGTITIVNFKLDVPSPKPPAGRQIVVDYRQMDDLGPTPDDLEKLEKSFTPVVGSVVDAQGSPVKGAEVHLAGIPNNVPLIVVNADKNGKFSTAVPPGTYMVFVKGDELNTITREIAQGKKTMIKLRIRRH